MSLCRFSTEIEAGITSDLYVYLDIYGGVTVHVAGQKRVPLVETSKIPTQAKFPDEDQEDAAWTHKYQEDDKKYREFFKAENEGITFKWEALPVEYANKSYNFSDKDSLVEFLVEAKNAGLNYPEVVLKMVSNDEFWNED